MVSPVKFTFDKNFDGGVKTDFEREVERLQQLVEDKRQDGIAQGRAEMLESIEQQAIAAIGTLQHSCQALLEQRRKMEAAVKRDAVHLASLIAGRLAPSILNARPEEEIETLIRDCFSDNIGERRLVIRIADCLTEHIEPRIKEMQKTSGFEGSVIVISDPHLPQSDCHIEWDDGGLERDGRKLMDEIETTVSRYIEHIYNPDKVSEHDPADTINKADGQSAGQDA